MKRLETERLLLAPLGECPDDIEDIQRYISAYNVARFLKVPWPYPEDGAQTFWQNQQPKITAGEKIIWGLRLKATPEELIGCIDYQKMSDDGRWGRGFWLASSFHSQGLMTEAVKVSLDYMFNETGMTVLTVVNLVGNAASRRIKEKTGTKFLGVFERAGIHGAAREERWELAKMDWLASSGG